MPRRQQHQLPMMQQCVRIGCWCLAVQLSCLLHTCTFESPHTCTGCSCNMREACNAPCRQSVVSLRLGTPRYRVWYSSHALRTHHTAVIAAVCASPRTTVASRGAFLPLEATPHPENGHRGLSREWVGTGAKDILSVGISYIIYGASPPPLLSYNHARLCSAACLAVWPLAPPLLLLAEPHPRRYLLLRASVPLSHCPSVPLSLCGRLGVFLPCLCRCLVCRHATPRVRCPFVYRKPNSWCPQYFDGSTGAGRCTSRGPSTTGRSRSRCTGAATTSPTYTR